MERVMRPPRNINEAARDAARFSRAKTLFHRYDSSRPTATGYTLAGVEGYTRLVLSPEGSVYQVDVFEKTCECPAFAKEGTCKHLLAVLIKEGVIQVGND